MLDLGTVCNRAGQHLITGCYTTVESTAWKGFGRIKQSICSGCIVGFGAVSHDGY